MSNHEKDPFEIEVDLQQWAAELGVTYDIGSQGTGQPIHDMSDQRVSALIASWQDRLREICGLPAIRSEEEESLRMNDVIWARLSEAEQLEWRERAIDWLSRNPTATIECLFDRRPMIDDDPEW